MLRGKTFSRLQQIRHLMIDLLLKSTANPSAEPDSTSFLLRHAKELPTVGEGHTAALMWFLYAALVPGLVF